MATRIQRNYKNGLFLMIFGNKKALLSLYNAVRGSNYTDPDNLTINTIEGVLYLGMKNDVSFIINNELNLYEAQSSWNPNMPLRGLFYFSRVYEGYIAEHELNIYSQTRLKLPTPNYIVFYNGTREEGDSRVLRLSDSFIKHDGEEACLECTATMININYGHNQKLMEACRELYEYSYLIEQIRVGLRQKLPLSDSVDQAVDHCIDQNILKNFLQRHRSEVKNMILEEFDLEKYLKLEKKESRTEGYNAGLSEGHAAGLSEGHAAGLSEGHAAGLSEGHAAGLSEGHAAGLSEGTSHGRAEFATLTQRLLADSRIDDLKKAATDPEYLELLLKEYQIA